MTNPIISVVLPCYNVAKYIKKCIYSIIDQSFYNFEIICIDDGSTDNTAKIIKSIAINDSRIKLISLDCNRGLPNGRKVGVQNAKGRYIAYIDPDDYVQPNYLQCLYNATKGGIIDLVIISGHYATYRFFKIKKQTSDNNLIGKEFYGTDIKALLPNFLGQGGAFSLSAWGKLYKKELLQNIPQIDVFYQEDVILNLYLFQRINSISFTNYNGYYYRTGGGSSVNPNYMIDMTKVYHIKKEYIRNNNLNDTESKYYIICELKNCFYEYIIRNILTKKTNEEIKHIIKNIISDKVYNDLKIIKNWYNPFINRCEFEAITNKNISKIISIAKNKITKKRRFKHYFKYYLGY